ncbi:MAG: AAA family ATPase [Salinivirgaceae bacterium]|jgi:predicted AAA+ superfamily ATPase|nr:AAA family ATPase [Salinivirgaceae bacterium]
MIYRKQIEKLKNWKKKDGRKPLIIRGARQVGKTTLINLFAREFDIFIPLNLEKDDDRLIFEKQDKVNQILQLLYLGNGRAPRNDESVLVFIDEIQNSAKAVAFLRYFFEEAPGIYLIATGSLLESLLAKKINFPVGRVEFLYLYPVSFSEFLSAYGNDQASDIIKIVPFPEFGHEKLSSMYKEYALIGGMPEIVNHYLKNKNIAALNPVFEALMLTYLDDVEQYASSQRQVSIIRFIIQNAFKYAEQRIKFEGFANSAYKSADVGDCFRLLEKTFLLRLIYPTTNTTIPIIENKRKSPKLQVLDTGMINCFAGLQAEFLNNSPIDSIYNGIIAEHIVGQELISIHESLLYKNSFWIREKKQSNAEVDYVINYQGLLIPIEVKSGKTGRLRSLMEFVDRAPHNFAVRIYSGLYGIEEHKTLNGKPYRLLNLPFYLVSELYNYLPILIVKI